MTTIKTSTNSTALMRSVLPRSVTPLDIAQKGECKVFSVMRPDFLVGSDSVSTIANIADPSSPFVQVNSDNQADSVYDDSIGRNVLEFSEDRARNYLYSGFVDYSEAHSFLSVIKTAAFDSFSVIIGDEASTTEQRASLSYQSNSRLRMRNGNGTAGSLDLNPSTWYAVIGSYDGVSSVKIEVLGQDVYSGTTTIEADGITTLRLGSASTSLGFVGRMDMGAFFTADLHGAGNSDLLLDVKTMLRQFYGSTVSGV